MKMIPNDFSLTSTCSSPVNESSDSRIVALETASALHQAVEYPNASGNDVLNLVSQKVVYPLFYLRMYGDLERHYGSDNIYDGYQHWLDHGMEEGRIPSPFFNPKFYLQKNADLRDAFGDDYKKATVHWVENGVEEGRWGSPFFHGKYYLEKHPDLQANGVDTYEEAFNHWAKHGRLEERETSSEYIPLNIVQDNFGFFTFGSYDRNHVKYKQNISENVRDPNALQCVLGIALLCTYQLEDHIFDNPMCKRLLERCQNRELKEKFLREDEKQYKMNENIRNMYTA